MHDQSFTGKLFLDADGEGSMSADTESLDYITRMQRDFGVNIVASNNSWGMPGILATYPPRALYKAISASIDADILFVAATGNDCRPLMRSYCSRSGSMQ